ncbi:hypothetical protein [Aeromonas media]|uniref:hypothetical protein n=1 Tax=Aeromonas media TaxID=651 RepID=UPI003D23F757
MNDKHAVSHSVISANEGHLLEKDGDKGIFFIGQWHWAKAVWNDDGRGEHITKKIGDNHYFLMCITHIGSNFIELNEPSGARLSSLHKRVLFSDAFEQLIFEPCHEQIIQDFINAGQEKSKAILGQISLLAAKFGLQVSGDVSSFVSGKSLPSPIQESSSTGIAVLSDVMDVNAFKGEMIVFKEKTLPSMQGDLERTCQVITKWVLASTMIPSAMMQSIKNDMKKIDDRIEDVGLYAGIDEDTVLVRDGIPAGADEMIHVMQRRLYMDEECLLDYDAGGMSFTKISEFDRWLCRNGNAERLLPFSKTVVAFKVRRKTKNYDNSIHAFVRFNLEKQDEQTFLYVRNGEKIYRISTMLDFDEMIFPSDDGFINEPVMVKMYCSKVDKVITVREYEQILAEAEKREADGDSSRKFGCFGGIHEDVIRGQYKAFDNQNVYFDEINQYFSDKIKKYNKVSVVLQGLLDRSEALSPHGRISLSKPSDFIKHIKLIYDAEYVLYSGEKPDFEAFRAALNDKITSESVFVGQHEAFVQRETDRENKRRLRSAYGDELRELDRYIPANNEGPGKLAIASKQMKTGKAVFTWYREPSVNYMGRDYYDKKIKDSITVPFSMLLNASAYQKGDYKRFFSDPRTRQEYLKWAPYLLMAENYACGMEEPSRPA